MHAVVGMPKARGLTCVVEGSKKPKSPKSASLTPLETIQERTGYSDAQRPVLRHLSALPVDAGTRADATATSEPIFSIEKSSDGSSMSSMMYVPPDRSR